MAFPRNTDFTTDDPEKLRVDLTLEHANVRDEFARIEREAPKRWVSSFVGESVTVRAERDGLYGGAGGFTVLTPGSPLPGDCFRVLSAGLSNVTVLSDDGQPIQGALTPDTWLATGFREYTYIASPLDARVQGWWRGA